MPDFPSIALLDWSKPFFISTDASDTGIAAVLSQHDVKGRKQVISLASSLLTKIECSCCVTLRELLAVVTFLIISDWNALCNTYTDDGALTWLQNFRPPEGQ